jgi:hypothetical protein
MHESNRGIKMTTITTTTDKIDYLAESNRLQAIAQSTECGYEGCDGTSHVGSDVAEDWQHTVVEDKFNDGSIVATISAVPNSATRYEGYLDVQWRAGTMTAAELRADADAHEAYPAWLRAMADRLDALNA